MAILSTLLSVAMPTGMWESIIWAFEGFTKNYVWAVVLLTVLIRIIWSPLDTYNRRITAKNAAVQAKMQPELQKIQEKYGNDKQLLNQKTNEVYRKYNFNIMGSCGFMLVFMVLNLVIFFTLFSGLNGIASYKIFQNYEHLKEGYANALYLADQNYDEYKTYLDSETEYEFRLFTDGDVQKVGFFEKDEKNAIFFGDYKTLADLAELDIEVGEGEEKRANDVLISIINKFKEDELVAEDEATEEIERVAVYDRFITDAMPLVENEYELTKESFGWIQNIWVADSPFKTSIFQYNEFAGLVRANNLEAGEETIYNAFMPTLSKNQGRVNGYFILPIVIIAVSFLSMWLSQRLMRKKEEQKPAKQGKAMQIIMPMIMGIFAIFYNSVFAIYMLTSQLISTALLPLQQFIVKKFDQASEKKLLQKQEQTTDYRRKF